MRNFRDCRYNARDCNLRHIYPGDAVRCVVDHYLHVNRDDEFEVLAVDNTCIGLRMPWTEEPFRYKSYNFMVIPNQPKENEKEKNMLYIAVRIDDAIKNSCGFETRVAAINEGSSAYIHAEATLDRINQWARDRIIAAPHEQWLLLAPTCIAETSAPPVRFRKV